MLDYAITLAPELHETMRKARAYEAESRTWLRRYRDLERSERRERKAERPVVNAVMTETVPAVFKTWI
jgi:hypothetical protein